MTTLSILVETCRELGADRHEVRGPNRFRRLMKVRREVARRCRDAGHSWPAIARVLGRKDHTTAMALVRGARKKAPVKRARLARAKYLVALGAGL